jgi:hypothetical protein
MMMTIFRLIQTNRTNCQGKNVRKKTVVRVSRVAENAARIWAFCCAVYSRCESMVHSFTMTVYSGINDQPGHMCALYKKRWCRMILIQCPASPISP